jgi:hypothetical protein
MGVLEQSKAVSYGVSAQTAFQKGTEPNLSSPSREVPADVVEAATSSPAAPLAKETVEAAELMVKEIMENDSHWSFTGEEVLRVAQALLSLSKEGR